MGSDALAIQDFLAEPEPILVIPRQKQWQAILLLVPLAVVILYLIVILVGRLLVPEWIETTDLWPRKSCYTNPGRRAAFPTSSDEGSPSLNHAGLFKSAKELLKDSRWKIREGSTASAIE
jgi:hypothetical protein